MKNLIFLVITIIIFIDVSCSFLFSDVKKISDQYYFDEDQILFAKEGDYKRPKICVIPSTVLAYERKKNYVFVKSKNCNNMIVYWIIALDESTDTTKHHAGTLTCPGYYGTRNIYGSLDSLEFIKDSITLYR